MPLTDQEKSSIIALNLSAREKAFLLKQMVSGYSIESVLREAETRVLAGKDQAKERAKIESSLAWKLYWKIKAGDPTSILDEAFAEYSKLYKSIQIPIKGPKSLLKWWLKTYRVGQRIPTELHSEMSCRMYDYFKTLMISEYIPETRQVCTKWLPNPKIPLGTHLKEIRMAITLIEPCGQGFKLIPLLEDSCCDHGYYSLHVDAKDGEKARLGIVRFGRDDHRKWTSLTECLAYILEHYPYSN